MYVLRILLVIDVHSDYQGGFQDKTYGMPLAALCARTGDLRWLPLLVVGRVREVSGSLAVRGWRQCAVTQFWWLLVRARSFWFP